MKKWMIVSLLALTGCSTAPVLPPTAPNVPFKRLSIDAFYDSAVVPLPLSIEIPAEYVHAPDLPVPLTYSYWMRPADVQQAAQGSLPADNGYVYGKVSLDVAYDAARDSFGDEDLEAQLAAAGARLSGKKRHKVARYPTLVMQITASNGNVVCAMYIATLVSTNVLYIAYRPAGNNAALCGRFLTSLQG